MINSRLIADLDPEAQTVLTRGEALCHAEGITILVTSTYRDYECQTMLWNQGRSTPGPIVTHAQAGQSFHNFRVAWDCIPLMNGKADWNVQDPPFQRMIALMKQAGAEAGYDWSAGKQDSDHFEIRPPNINDTASAKAIFDAHGTLFV